MAAGLGDAVRAIVADKGIPEDLILKIIDEFLKAAYKRKFNTDENAVVQFTDDGNDVTLYAQKKIVEEVEDPVEEIALEEALELNPECEVGDELLIEIDPKEFDRVAIQNAKQRARQRLREIQKDTLYSEFKDKKGQLVIGYVQRERNGNIFIDLGKTEGIMPRRYQSPREVYRPNDRIKALVVEVEKGQTGLQIVLSRTHTELVKRIFELEVPEIYAQTVEISKIVREAGYRTKIAVFSNREDVDPVGACVGLRGVRIQAIVRELEGEKIDILKYDPNPRVFIKNALSPAEVTSVVVLDEIKRHALAIVPETQLSLAIGKQGLNVRLANRLADWNIDVKTEEQFEEMDLSAETKRAVSALFGDSSAPSIEEISKISELPNVPENIIASLDEHELTLIEEVVGMTRSEIQERVGLSSEDANTLIRILAENVEIVEEEDEEAYGEDNDGEYDDEYEDEGEDDDEEEGEIEESDVIETIAELPGMNEALVEALEKAGITDLQQFIELDPASIDSLEGVSEEDAEAIRAILTENIEIVEETEED